MDVDAVTLPDGTSMISSPQNRRRASELWKLDNKSKPVRVDDEDDDPTQNPLVVFLATRLPLVNGYDDAGNFFVRVEIDKWGVPKLPAENSEFTPNTKMKDHPVPVFKSSDWYHTPRFVDETGKEIGSGKQTQEQAGTGNTFGELHL